MAEYVLTIAGGKGGVGKTTTAVNVGAALQTMGHDVVVVDADLGMANLGAMLRIQHEASLHEVLAGEASIDDAIAETDDELTIIPGEQSLEAFADADPAKLREVVESLREAYDIVVIDTGAGLSHEVAVPLGLADEIILVTTPETVAVGDTIKTAEMSARIDGTVMGAILNRVSPQTEVLKIADKFTVPLIGVIPDDPRRTRSEPIVLESPDSTASDAYRRLAGHLERHIFKDVAIEDLGMVLEKSWFVDEDAEGGGAHPLASGKMAASSSDDTDEDESSGRFGLFR